MCMGKSRIRRFARTRLVISFLAASMIVPFIVILAAVVAPKVLKKIIKRRSDDGEKDTRGRGECTIHFKKNPDWQEMPDDLKQKVLDEQYSDYMAPALFDLHCAAQTILSIVQEIGGEFFVSDSMGAKVTIVKGSYHNNNKASGENCEKSIPDADENVSEGDGGN